MIPRPSQPRAFTLLELVLVLMVIGVALAVVAPNLRGWRRSEQLRDAADHFVSVTQWARTQAAATGKIHRLVLVAENASGDGQPGYQVQVQDGQGFASLRAGEDLPLVESGTSLSRGSLPAGYRLELASDRDRKSSSSSASRDSIDFYPNGRTGLALVRITSDVGESIEIECATPTEGFRVIKPGELR